MIANTELIEDQNGKLEKNHVTNLDQTRATESRTPDLRVSSLLSQIVPDPAALHVPG
jgi:hypothetical protein